MCVVWTGKKAYLQEPPPGIPALYDLGKRPRKGRCFVVWQGFIGLQGPSLPLFCKHAVLALILKAPVCMVSPTQVVICGQEWYSWASEPSCWTCGPVCMIC